MDALGLGRVRLVGHDSGGWLGFALCLLAPERFAGFVALNTTHPWPGRARLVRNAWRFWYTALWEYPGAGGWVLRHWPGFTRFLLRRWAGPPYLGAMAAVPEAGGTRFAALGGFRLPGARLARPLLTVLGDRSMRAFAEHLELRAQP